MKKFDIHEWQANQIKQRLTEHTVNFSKDDMATLHNDGKLVKADDDGKDHTYIFKGDLKEQDDEDLRLEPEDGEYEDGTEFYDEEDYDFDPEDGVVDEIELKDLDFETLKSFFPKFYQKVKFTRTQPNGEEGPYYRDSISFPNLDDSTMEIGDASALEDWKNKVLRRFGNVEIEFNDQAKNHFDRVFIHSDDFNDARDEFIKGKMSALNR